MPKESPKKKAAPQVPASAALTLDDTTVTLAPYFKVKDLGKFKEIWKAAYDPFAHKDDCVHYSFGFTEDGTRAHCREAYTSAKTALQHLADVDAALKGCSTAWPSSSASRCTARRPRSTS